MFTADARGMSGMDVGLRTYKPLAGSQQSDESPLTAEEVNALREHLEQMRQWLLQSIATVEEQSARSVAQHRVTVSSLDSKEWAWEQAMAQRALAGKRLLLREVMQAFERIQSNTYGRCLGDDSPLSRALLDDLPWAKYCPKCASRHA